MSRNGGAGFVGSGPVVLLLELVDRIGPSPARSQQVLLYSAVAVFTYIGALSLQLLPFFQHYLEVAHHEACQTLKSSM